MSVRGSVALASGPLFFAAVVAACGGKTVRIDIVVTAEDIACSSDQDCTQTQTGEVCANECTCGDTPVNQTALAKFLAMDNTVGVATCLCMASASPKCVHGQCIWPDGGGVSHTDAGDVDADNTSRDAAFDADGSADAPPSAGCPMFGGGVCPANTMCNVYFCPSTAPTYATPCSCGSDGQWIGLCAASCPAQACVDIDLSTYDTSCVENIDCITIQSGEVCSGSCDCGGSPVSASEQARYDQATSGIVFAGCPCPSGGLLECIAGTCVICGYGPNRPAGCPDAG